MIVRIYGGCCGFLWFLAAKNKAKQSQFIRAAFSVRSPKDRVQRVAYCETLFEKTKRAPSKAGAIQQVRILPGQS